MNTSKTNIYLVPGLAASSKIFEFLQFSSNVFELHYLEWLLPLSEKESLESYSKRMANLVVEDNPVLIGVSFGGILVQEMSKFLNPKKVIIISSIKSKNELPKHLKIIQKTKAYKLFPTKNISTLEDFAIFVFGSSAKKRVKLYKEYLSVRNKLYLTWALYQVLNWQQEEPLKNVLHIHGDEDLIFPIKYIQNCILVKKGTHVMVLNKAKSISKIIEEAI